MEERLLNRNVGTCRPHHSSSKPPGQQPPYPLSSRPKRSAVERSAVYPVGPRHYFELISRIRAVRARPGNSLKVPNCGESTTLFTTAGLLRLVAFSKTPRKPK